MGGRYVMGELEGGSAGLDGGERWRWRWEDFERPGANLRIFPAGGVLN